MAVGGVAPLSEGSAIVLMDDTAKRGLVLFVGGTEAFSISLRLEHKHFERPLTHDLFDHAIKELGGDVVGVRVNKLENDVYYGSVLIDKGGKTLELDARPSDAIALAIGNAAPVFVADTVLDEAGIEIDKFDFRKLIEGGNESATVRGKAGNEVEL